MKISNKKRNPIIWIHAPNVHTGGARNLLIEIVNYINSNSYKFILDKRFESNSVFEKFDIYYVNPNLFSRFFSELYLFLNCTCNDTVLSFGNLPPLFPTKAFVINYYQSPFIIQTRSINFFKLKTKIRIVYERIWTWICRNHVDIYVVQSETVRNEISKKCRKQIVVYPFIRKIALKYNKKNEDYNRNGFIYVSSGEPHKNHLLLIDAWIELSKMNLYPVLKLTLSPKINSRLLKHIQKKSLEYNLNIINLGTLSYDNVIISYLESEALIFPSKFETFGLPLYEAAQIGLPILASERDFVRDIVNPIQTFDPDSSKSIARAVERFIRGANTHNLVYDGQSFVANLESKFNCIN